VDGDIDLDDYGAFDACGVMGLLPPSPADPTIVAQCNGAFDFDGSGVLDLLDFGGLQARFGRLVR
jgi:hypothetical protein